jgi:hypothetical protein
MCFVNKHFSKHILINNFNKNLIKYKKIQSYGFYLIARVVHAVSGGDIVDNFFSHS